MVAVLLIMSMSLMAMAIAHPSEADAIDNEVDRIAVQESEVGVVEFRQALTDAGYDVSIYSDETLEVALSSFSNKNLVGKYAWNDPTGVNWLLEKAGVDGTISEITLLGSGVVIVANGISYALTAELLAFGPIGWIVAAGVFVLGVYTGIMQSNALNKANVALGLIAQQKDYAVYETTVLWNLMPNGYEVEEW
mgnify:CR=1 FL=1